MHGIKKQLNFSKREKLKKRKNSNNRKSDNKEGKRNKNNEIGRTNRGHHNKKLETHLSHEIPLKIHLEVEELDKIDIKVINNHTIQVVVNPATVDINTKESN